MLRMSKERKRDRYKREAWKVEIETERWWLSAQERQTDGETEIVTPRAPLGANKWFRTPFIGNCLSPNEIQSQFLGILFH